MYIIKTEKGKWVTVSFTYKHENEIVTQLGFGQPDGAKLIKTFAVDDIKIYEGKNVPIFAALLSAVSDGRAKVGTLSRNIVIARRLMVSEGWYIGGGGFVKSPLLCRLLFVLFLPTQEKNLSYC